MSAFTTAQQQAIAARGNVLVVAGAGTGKTRTLVERCVRLVLDEGCSLEQILMVTFTEAAAAEMRQRIRAELVRRWESEPENPRLNEQLALLDTARIATLHGFCLQLVRQHFHELEIDPQVVVLDEAQTRPLLEQALDALVEQALGSEDAGAKAVRELLRAHGRGADGRVRELIVKLHRHAQSLANPAAWWAGQEEVFREVEPTRWREWLRVGCEEWGARWLPVLREQSQENLPAGRAVRALELTLTEAGEWAAALDEIAAADGAWPKGKKGVMRKPLEKFFEEAEFLRSQFPGAAGRDPLAEDWAWVRGSMGALLGMAREFTVAFSRAKRELGGVDFADLEQFALRLLRDAASGAPTRVAELWRRQLRHVFVDEYQDINGAQDAILAAVSREGEHANRFLVGDIKQSIYRFRLANPRIFLGYEAAWRGDSSAGQRIPLADNFRSREGILEFLNPLFAALMRPAVGGVVYDADARLRFGNREGRAELAMAGQRDGGTAGENFPKIDSSLDPSDRGRSAEHTLGAILDRGSLAEPVLGAPVRGRDEEGPETERLEPPHVGSYKDGARVELHVVAKPERGGDEGEENGWGDLEATEREARVIAGRLRELRAEGHEIWDEESKAMRAVRWGDMAVLLRSPGPRAEAFAKEFHRLGVPLVVARGGFFTSLEVSDLLALLRLLDNPVQDLPLLAVLRSPLVGLSAAELATVRVGRQAGLFWDALRRFQREGAAAGRPFAATDEWGENSAKQESGFEPLNSDLCARPASAVLNPKILHRRGGTGAEDQENGGRDEETTQGEQPSSTRLSPPPAGGEGEGAEGVLSTARSSPIREASASSSSVAAAAGQSGWAKVNDFLERFEVWRERMRQTSLSYCLETALAETHYEALLLAEARGPERVANVRRLLDLARQYDPYQRQGLYRFLRFIEAQADAEPDLAPAAAATDAVKLLSIHKSKGLEFPVVVVGGLGAGFNFQSLSEDILLNEYFGLCPRVIPPDAEQSYPSLPWWLAQQRERRELLGEELRLLYVALTRARDTLILTGGTAKPERWAGEGPRALTDAEVVGARSFLDWLRLWLPLVTRASDWVDDANGGNALLRWKFHFAAGAAAAGGDAEETRESPVLAQAAAVDAAGWARLGRRATAEYPWLGATLEPAKTSVSVLRRRQLEADEEAKPTRYSQPASGSFELKSGAGAALSATERGTAHHAFMELVAVERTGSLAELQAEGARMVEAGWLRAVDVAALNWEGLAGFWASELGEAVRRNAARVHRELPFTARVEVEELQALGLHPPGAALPEDEFVVVQGVVDLALILRDEIWLVDFKTDRVSAGDWREKARAYEAQLGLYGRALAGIYHRPVRRKWLYFLEISRAVEVP